MADKNSNKMSLNLAKKLAGLYDQICVVSERMRNCNGEFIQKLHQAFEEDEKYKDFKTAVLATCITQITSGAELREYLKELDAEIDKISKEVHEAVDKYSYDPDPWEKLKVKGGEKYFETVSNFYYEHFLTAQRFVLSAWLAKRRGDPLFMYKGPE